MSGTLLICPYFGDLPPWWDRYAEEEIPRLERQGYMMLLDFDESAFRERALDYLGVELPQMWGTGKIWDLRCTLGLLYEEELRGYDWWGHTDFDCVYGLIHAPNERYDAVTDCAYNYLSGPWTLYRNKPWIARAFSLVPDWKKQVTSPTPTGWHETTFSQMLGERGNIFVYDRHAYTQPDLLRRAGDRLYHGSREISFFHFRRTKKWPL